jgi:hypothetical protein
MFAKLFRRAEASVDNAIGDLGNRVVVAVPFLIAIGFAAASLSLTLNKTYGPEVGNLLVAGVFGALGLLTALIFKMRNNSKTAAGDAAADEMPKTEAEGETGADGSIFDDETVMAVLSSAAPIIVPAMLRTGLKNWPLLLSIAAGLYVISRPGETAADTSAPSPQPKANGISNVTNI